MSYVEPMSDIMTQAAFAELCQVKPPAISKAIREGKVLVTKKRKVNITLKTNQLYLAARNPQRGNDTQVKASGKASKKSEEEAATKFDADLAKIQVQTAKLQVELAKEMNVLVLNDMVERAFGKLNGTFTSHVLPMGQRISKDICAVFGDTSPEKKLAVQKIVDDENEKVVEAVKRVTTELVLENP